MPRMRTEGVEPNFVALRKTASADEFGEEIRIDESRFEAGRGKAVDILWT